jgi:hypothetical protein
MISPNLPLSSLEDQVKSIAPAEQGQAHISCPCLVANEGVDTLVVTLDCEIPKSLLGNLKDSKSELQTTTKDCEYVPFGETSLFSWNLQRTGIKYYPFVLKTGDLSLFLSTRKPGSSVPNCQISIGSLSCQKGLIDLVASIRKWLIFHKIYIKTEKVSRIDLCADVTCDFQALGLLDRSRYITKAEHFAAYWSFDNLTGVQIGKGAIVGRIYDKPAEMVEKNALHKQEFFNGIWLGKVDSYKDIARVEFQLRRAAVKEFFPEDSTISTVFSGLSGLWKYLTQDWLRQASSPIDRANKHQSRSSLSDFWLCVQSAFSTDDCVKGVRNKRQKHINIKALVDQASGIMLTVAAALDHLHSDFFGILGTASQLVQERLVELFEHPGFEHDFNSRATCATITF